MTFQERWAEQLRAGAREIIEKADAIVGDLTGNVAMIVSIHLYTDSEKINDTTIEIQRTLHSHEMWKVKLDQYKRQAGS